jgi:hypothetical protein
MPQSTLEHRIVSQGIPKILLADMAQVNASDVSSWLKGRPVAAHKIARLESVLKSVESMLAAIYPVRVDLSDAENVKRSIEAIATAQA